MFQSKMKKRKTGREESVNGNEGDDEGFESSPEKVTTKFNFQKLIIPRHLYHMNSNS